MSPPSFNVKRQRSIARRSREDARQYTYRVIRDFILELDLSPGQKLNENDFASLMDVSRTPIHDTFIRLSRENLVDIIPRRGAFVSRMDTGRIEHAVWIIRLLGITALHAIFIHNTHPDDLTVLYDIINNSDDDMTGQDNTGWGSSLIREFYHQIFLLAGDMDLIWDSVQKIAIDLHRLLTLALGDKALLQGALLGLGTLTDALMQRDNDLACSILNAQMSQILQIIPPIKKRKPEYFVC